LKKSYKNDRLKTCPTLVAIAAQKIANASGFNAANDIGTAKVAFALLAHTGSQVACSGGTVLHFARRRETEPLFGSLVGFLLRHDCTSYG
jgi:hypothetical protein